MTHFDSLQVGSAATSVTAATLGHIAPHPLQYLVWIVAIIAGVFSIYRGWAADRRAIAREENPGE
jgi:hypothetical protein